MTEHTDAALRERAVEIMRFVRGAQGMTHDERAWFIERIIPILAALRDAARAECLGVPEDLARSGATTFAKLLDDEKQAFNQFVRIAREGARAEQREADAQVAESYPSVTPGCEVCNGIMTRIAAAIRAQGQP